MDLPTGPVQQRPTISRVHQQTAIAEARRDSSSPAPHQNASVLPVHSPRRGSSRSSVHFHLVSAFCLPRAVAEIRRWSAHHRIQIHNAILSARKITRLRRLRKPCRRDEVGQLNLGQPNWKLRKFRPLKLTQHRIVPCPAIIHLRLQLPQRRAYHVDSYPAVSKICDC